MMPELTIDPNTLRQWYLDSRRNMLVCAPAKCGSNAVRRAINPKWAEGNFRRLARRHKCGPFAPADLSLNKFKGVARYLVVRDPVDRFASLWRDKCRDGRGSPRILEHTKGLTPDQLMDLIERYPFGNSHWYPQYAYKIPGAIPVRINTLLELMGVDPTAVVGGTTKFDDDPPMPVERIMQHYRHDKRLYEEACAL